MKIIIKVAFKNTTLGCMQPGVHLGLSDSRILWSSISLEGIIDVFVRPLSILFIHFLAFCIKCSWGPFSYDLLSVFLTLKQQDVKQYLICFCYLQQFLYYFLYVMSHFLLIILHFCEEFYVQVMLLPQVVKGLENLFRNADSLISTLCESK